MDITVYLPDDIGTRAKAEGINLSRLLRDGVVRELERRDMTKQTLAEPRTYEVAVEDRDNKTFVGRVTGKLITSSGDVDVYLTTDERVLVHDRFRLEYWESEDPQEDLRERLQPSAYMEAMDELGFDAIIDL